MRDSNTAPWAWPLLACLSLTPACDAPALDPRAQAPTEVRTEASEVGFGLDVLSIKECNPPAYAALESDEVLLGVQVEISAKTSGVPQNYYYGTLRDAEGRSYGPTFGGCEPRLSGKPLATGQTARGFINFRLPRRAQGLDLVYAARIAASKKSRGPGVSRELGR